MHTSPNLTMSRVALERAQSGARTAARLLLLLLVAGCGNDATSPGAGGVPERSLTFVRPAPNSPALATGTVSFWARRGEDREVRMFYRPRPGAGDSSRFLKFEVPGAALDRRPDGTRFAVGDSVLITLVVVDPASLKVEFAPAGLRFSASSPARLEIELAEVDDDLDRDGDIDAEDARLETRLSVWRQEQPGAPWFRQQSVVVLDLDEIEADIFGFTAYAVAY